jgi:TctA family transporter
VEGILGGLAILVDPYVMLMVLLGTVLGIFVGALPGISGSTTIALMLPMTIAMGPIPAICFLGAIYCAANFGGSITAILVNAPGDPSASATALEGYKMAEKGQAGLALGMSAIASAIGGIFSVIVLIVAAPALARSAYSFGPPEYFALALFGLSMCAAIGGDSPIKNLIAAALGLLIATVGMDLTTGVERFAFGVTELSDGIGFVPVAMGMFGIAEIILNLERPESRSVLTTKVDSLFLTREETKRAIAPVIRGTLIGSVLGILPGGGAALAAFGSYMLERKVSKYRHEFGTGAIEGVAGPEAANNAAAQTSFIPLLTLGIPANAVMALMVGALIIQGIQPGPRMVEAQPDLFWGLICSMWVGNLMLLVINLPLIGMWVKLLEVPYRHMYPSILIFCAIGVYSLNNNVFDVYLTVLFGLFGYLCSKLKMEPAPLLIGFVLGPMMEEHLRRAMLLSRGDPMVFVERPISATLLAIGALALGAMMLPNLRSKKEAALAEGG